MALWEQYCIYIGNFQKYPKVKIKFSLILFDYQADNNPVICGNSIVWVHHKNPIKSNKVASSILQNSQQSDSTTFNAQKKAENSQYLPIE